MITEEEFLATELSVGISPDNPDFVELARQTAERVISACGFKTVMDYGAGTGVYASEMSKQGKDVIVWEKFKPHREFIKNRFPHLEIIPAPITTDLMMFIEVAEHMTDDELLNLFTKIQPNFILFSSTSERTEQDEAWGHINIKSQQEWIDMFDTFGYSLKQDMNLPTNWSKLFERR
jgi:hypothetical protein